MLYVLSLCNYLDVCTYLVNLYVFYKYIIILLGKSIFSFDGTANTIVDLRSTLQCVQGNNPRSISFMIQTATTAYANIVFTGSNEAWKFFGICINCGGATSGILVIDAWGNYISSNGKAVNDGLWHTVFVTYDGTTLSIYVDGRLDSTATNWNAGGFTATIASTVNTVGNSGNYLGVGRDGSSAKWIGSLKNVLFYDYVISNSYALANSYQFAGSIIYNSGN